MRASRLEERVASQSQVGRIDFVAGDALRERESGFEPLLWMGRRIERVVQQMRRRAGG